MDVLKFKLEITLGNDAMQTANDVALLLDDVSLCLMDGPDLRSGDSKKLQDDNGNTVGKWEITS